MRDESADILLLDVGEPPASKEWDRVEFDRAPVRVPRSLIESSRGTPLVGLEPCSDVLVESGLRGRPAVACLPTPPGWVHHMHAEERASRCSPYSVWGWPPLLLSRAHRAETSRRRLMPAKGSRRAAEGTRVSLLAEVACWVAPEADPSVPGPERCTAAGPIYGKNRHRSRRCGHTEEGRLGQTSRPNPSSGPHPLVELLTAK